MTALLGGIGNPFGALVSGFLIGGLSSLSDYYLTAQWTPALLLLILILLFAWRPNGFTSEGDGGETTVVRDSVILTAPVQGSSGRRWLVIALLVLFAFPLMFEFLVVTGRITKPKPFEFTFALEPLSDTEAIVTGLGVGAGETLEVIHQSGEEFGQFSGYRLKRTSAE